MVTKRRPRVGQRAGLERSFRDAQRVLSGYIESGGKQVKDTIASLLRIFELEGDKRTRAKNGRGAAKRPTARPRKVAAKSVASRRGATRRSKAAGGRAKAGRRKATVRS